MFKAPSALGKMVKPASCGLSLRHLPAPCRFSRHRKSVSGVGISAVDLTPKLEETVNKALEKDRKLRYQSAAEIRTDLQRLKRDSDTTRSAAATAQAESKSSRKSIRMGGGRWRNSRRCLRTGCVRGRYWLTKTITPFHEPSLCRFSTSSPLACQLAGGDSGDNLYSPSRSNHSHAKPSST
jgi:hypothetical protein